MRLAVKIFLAFSLIILVFGVVAAWSINKVAKLSINNRPIAVGGAEALSNAVSVREAVAVAKRLDLRSQVFGNDEYDSASDAEADLVTHQLQQLSSMVTTDQEKTLLAQAVTNFATYKRAVSDARSLRKRNPKLADKLYRDHAGPVADNVIDQLDDLVALTRTGLEESQREATASLNQARIDLEKLRDSTGKAVTIAMLAAMLLALIVTAVIAAGLTRSLRRLSDATKALADGKFREPLRVDSKDEVGALAAAFNSMVVRLREIDAMKEHFYATVSHELRSPLNGMRETIRIMEQRSVGPLTPKQERLTVILSKGCDRLLRLVNSVLDLSRADAGMMPVERHWFSLEQAVTHAIDEFRLQAEHRGIALRVELGSGPERILGDEDRIVQVVINLVANALRFTPSGGSVTVKLDHTDKEVLISVQDTGIGISPVVLPVIFNRFRQAHSGKGGTGLGLAIVKSLVEAHDGHVSVESEEGKGSCFTVSLPRQTPALVAVPVAALQA